MTITEGNHYVPKFYFKPWWSGGKLRGKLYKYDLIKNKGEIGNGGEVGKEKYLYPQELEEAFWGNENSVAPILRKINDSKINGILPIEKMKKINKNKILKLYHFVYTLRSRSPKLFKQLKSITLEKSALEIGYFGTYVSLFSKEKREQMEKGHIVNSFTNNENLEERILKSPFKDLTIVIAKIKKDSDEVFITSNYPLICFNDNSNNKCFFITTSPKTALFFLPINTKLNFVDNFVKWVNESIVYIFNLNQINDHEIYGRIEDKDYIDSLIADIKCDDSKIPA